MYTLTAIENIEFIHLYSKLYVKFICYMIIDFYITTHYKLMLNYLKN